MIGRRRVGGVAVADRGGASLLLALLLVMAPPASAAEPPACRSVRLAEIGWSDVTATTAVAAFLLEGLGYEPRVQLLSVPITFASMQNGDIDAFLGAWMPSMASDMAPYVESGAIEKLAINLTGAKYTLVVPDYVQAAGVRDFGDLQAHAARFGQRIYGIEPGNDGNRIVRDMIQAQAFGLGGWRLVESSEQGMLTQVARSIAAGEWIVFLGWEPHPMNLRYRLAYLSGGDAWFGPDFGAATVWTTTRRNYRNDCPNAVRLLRNLQFDVDAENLLMAAILSDGLPPRLAAQRWLAQNPAWLAATLAEVSTFTGEPGLAAVREHLRRSVSASSYPRLPLGRWAEEGVGWIARSLGMETHAAASRLETFLRWLTASLARIPALLLIAVICAASFAIQRSRALVALVAGGLLLILNLGYWREMIDTATLVLFSAGLSILAGVPIGILAARREWIYTVLRPLLDLMQTIPTFVYLIPALMLFGLGLVPGVVATIIFALPAPIRLTYLGIRGVPTPLREAGIAFGASRLALLLKVELPHARPAILAGITECIMLSLSMVVIAALVGAQGLGEPVVRALNTVDVAQGFEAGLAIVILAILLDRLLRHTRRRRQERP
jgi:glycine betaine/proline transport system substrate-binding protein